MSLRVIRKRLKDLADPEQAEFLQRFFKTGPGEYAAGDRFMGIRVPETRRLAREFRTTSLADCERMLQSAWHEERLLALVILTLQFDKGDEPLRRRIYELYLANTDRINNWDLVDVSAHKIVGVWLADRSRRPLSGLVKSESLWERRIAVIATLAFIKRGELDDTFNLARRLLHDDEDLIHKAVGWMLREAGKVDEARLEVFLGKHVKNMPRTMLRYAIEKLPETKRKQWLAR